MSNALAICHYEDEPGKVDLPELIEAGLYAAGYQDCLIELEGDDRKKYVIKFKLNKNNCSIFYLVESDREKMLQALEKIGRCVEVLSIVDTTIFKDRHAGINIVQGLRQSGTPLDDIWMLTGYAAETAIALEARNLSVRVIPKPPNHRQLRDEIVSLINKQLKLQVEEPENS